ncbi:hypothetical protein RFI_06769 [Reticulomyxa filosa]|uniref:TNF family profile domain-containing protein n=1 Tax=Reticulomyxa filosa TaxID=46433 RepID=X6NWK0_RETFI|nr:hypothetical protein RFI_06769 [Reticulomyxa filosa]|eukprot:ETO30351.1 hypothetical protein RFI_06769 [Reticulomyxa filosa]
MLDAQYTSSKWISTNNKEVEIACWQSSAFEANTCFRLLICDKILKDCLNYLPQMKWNHCVFSTDFFLFKLQRDGTEVIVEKAGIYNIFATVRAYTTSEKYARLYINGTVAASSDCETGGDEHQSMCLHYVCELECNDKIQVYCTPPVCTIKECNILSIQRMGEKIITDEENDMIDIQ